MCRPVIDHGVGKLLDVGVQPFQEPIEIHPGPSPGSSSRSLSRLAAATASQIMGLQDLHLGWVLGNGHGIVGDQPLHLAQIVV